MIALEVGTAQAAPPDTEAGLIRHAVGLRRKGDDRGALVELERVYQSTHSARAAAQLGFVEQALGLWPEAEGHVTEAMRDPADPWVRKHRVVVVGALATIRAHVGRLEIVGGEQGARISINGHDVGSVPLRDPVAVSAGPVEVEMRASGYAPAVKNVTVAAGEYARLPFTLRPLARPQPTAQPTPSGRVRPIAAAAAPPPTPTAPPPALALAAPAPSPSEPRLVAEETPPGDGRGRRLAGIGLVAGGVAAIGGGVAASLVAKRKFDAINADAAADRPYDDGNGNWKSYEKTATVLYLVGGGALVGGVVLYATARDARSETKGMRSASLRPQLAPGRAGAALSVRF